MVARLAAQAEEDDRAAAAPPAGPEMVPIRPGSFTMGISKAETKAEGWELDNHARPQHKVAIQHAFLLGKYPVTVGEYAEFTQAIGRKTEPPDFPQNDRHPAVNVSFADAMAYCQWLSDRTGLDYRLPSEAEWEYACRAGTQTARWWGNKLDPKMADFNRQGTTEVDAHRANQWGLYDMLGNVWEWCADPWHDDYEQAPTDGSAWTTGGSNEFRVVRGGSWYGGDGDDRSGYRGRCDEAPRPWVGFRLSSTPPCQSWWDQGPAESAEVAFRGSHDDNGPPVRTRGHGARPGPVTDDGRRTSPFIRGFEFFSLPPTQGRR